jgi:hypothetical protein
MERETQHKTLEEEVYAVVGCSVIVLKWVWAPFFRSCNETAQH